MLMKKTRMRHADLVDGMANKLGFDLEEKIMEGHLDIETLGQAVLRCTGCADPDGCAHWQAAQEGIAPQAPGICRNADLFEMLKQGKRV